jgi:hypothetical protein
MAPHSVVPFSVVVELDECSLEFGGVLLELWNFFWPLFQVVEEKGPLFQGSIPYFCLFSALRILSLCYK